MLVLRARVGERVRAVGGVSGEGKASEKEKE